MGFLSDAWKAITKIAEVPIQKLEQADPLARAARPVLRAVGLKDAPAQSFMNQLHRDTRSQYGQAALPVIGGIAGTIFMGPGYGTALGAAGGRAIAGAERNESDVGIVKGAAITGGTTYAGMQAGALGGAYGGTAGRIAATSAASGASSAGAQYANTGRVNAQDVGMAMATPAISQGVGAGLNYAMSPSYTPMTMPDAPYDPGYASASKDAAMIGNVGQKATSAGMGYGYNQWKQAQAQKETEQRMESYLESLRQQDIQAAEQTETSVYNPYKKNKIDEMLQNQGNKFPFSGYQQYRST